MSAPTPARPAECQHKGAAPTGTCAYTPAARLHTLHNLAGPGDSPECGEDKFKPAGEVCDARVSDSPCMHGGKCSGEGPKCSKVKKALTGTPCNSAGLFEEALDEKGRLAIKGQISQVSAGGLDSCGSCTGGLFAWSA